MELLQTPSSDPFNLLQWGVLGLVILALLTGWLWAKPAVDELRERIKQHETNVVPALESLEATIENLRASMYGFAAASEAEKERLHEAIKKLEEIYENVRKTPSRGR